MRRDSQDYRAAPKQPQEGGKGKGKGKGKGSGKGARPTSPWRTGNSTWGGNDGCFACQRLNRPSNHDWRTCPEHLRAERPRSPGVDREMMNKLLEISNLGNARLDKLERLFVSNQAPKEAPAPLK